MDPRGEVDAFGSYSSSASEVVRGSFSGRQKPVKDVGHHESEHRPKLCVGQFSSRGASEMVRICFNRAIIVSATARAIVCGIGLRWVLKMLT